MVGLFLPVLSEFALLSEELQFDLVKPFGEECFEQIGHQVSLLRLLLLDEVFQADKNLYIDLVGIELVDFVDNVGV